MIDILMYISSGLIIISYISYFILVFIGRKNIVSKSTGFDASKDIISEYNSINIIESKNYFTIYNIKRNVIKLASKCYYGKDLSSISLSLIEAGNSVLNSNKNKFIYIIGKFFSNLKILYIFPLIVLILNITFYSITDVIIGILIVLLCSFISFNLVDIKTKIYNWLCDDLEKIKDINKNNRLKIMSFINILLFLDKIIFVSETLILVKFIVILLGIN